MLQFLSQQNLPTEAWLKLLKDLSLYDLSHMRPAQRNAQNAMNQLLLQKGGFKASVLQKKMLNRITFDPYQILSLTRDDEERSTWIQLGHSALRNEGSYFSHQTACLVFLGYLLNVSSESFLKKPEEILTLPLIVNSSGKYTGLIEYCAHHFSERTYEIILQFLQQNNEDIINAFDNASALENQEELIRTLGIVYYYADEPTKQNSFDTLQGYMETIRNTTMDRTNDINVLRALCKAYEIMAPTMPLNHRLLVVDILERLIHINNKADNLIRYIVAKIRAVDNPDALFHFVHEIFNHPNVQLPLPIPINWIVEHASDDLLPHIVQLMMKWLRDDRDEYRGSALDFFRILAHRLSQEMLICIAKELINLYPNGQFNPQRFSFALIEIIQNMRDDGLELLYSALQHTALKEWLFKSCSATFFKKKMDEKTESNDFFVGNIWIDRAMLFGFNRSDELSRTLAETLKSSPTPNQPSMVHALVIHLLEKHQQKIIIDYLLGLFQGLSPQHIQQNTFQQNALPWLTALMYCLPVMEQEHFSDFKKIIGIFLKVDCSRETTARLLTQHMHRIKGDPGSLLEGVSLDNTLEISHLKYALQCEQAVRNNEYFVGAVVGANQRWYPTSFAQ